MICEEYFFRLWVCLLMTEIRVLRTGQRLKSGTDTLFKYKIPGINGKIAIN